MAVDYSRAPILLMGGGLVFFNDIYMGHITRFERTFSMSETLGRFKGHAISNVPNEKNCLLNLHFDDNRPEMLRYTLNKLANNWDSLTVPPSCQGSAQFSHMQPLTLLASTVGVTLSEAAGVVKVVYKKDFSVEYTQATDYTATAGVLIRLDDGGAIDSGQEVFVGYTFEDADALRMELGRGHGLTRGKLHVVFIEPATGYLVQFSTDNASPIGDHSLVCDMSSDWAGTDVQYRVFYDAADDAPYGNLLFGSSAVKSILGT